MQRTFWSRAARATLIAWFAWFAAMPFAHAEDAPTPKEEKPAEHETTKKVENADDERANELVKRILTTDAEEEDLAWLYSNADEYSPSGLTGKPIPAPALPSRGEGSPRHWDPRFRKFSAGNYVLTVAGFATNVASFLIPPKATPWRGENSVDTWGRQNLGSPSYEAGQWARDLSDVLVSLNVAYPLLVDSLIVSYWYRRSPEVATQIALISLEAEAVTSLIQGPTAGFTSRERPYGRDCGKSIPENLDACAGRDRYRSFFSGHTSVGFAAATVTCSHHARHELFGDGLADGLACGAALTSAATVGTMRIVGNKHYVTDVLTGAAVGTLSGLGVPWLLHYGPLARLSSTRASDRFSVTLIPLPGGIAAGGTF